MKVFPHRGAREGRRNARSLSTFIVPLKQGESIRETPEQGREASGHRPVHNETQEVAIDNDGIVSTKMERIALNAKRLPDVSFTSLSYHIDPMWLNEARKAINPYAAIGIDRVTAAEYEINLEQNLKTLMERFKSGR